MTIPTIHLNGTSRERLEGHLVQTYSALVVAYECLKFTAPNGRDYYPQGPDALERAIAEHNSRMQRVQSVMDELDAILGAIEETK